VYGRRRSTHRRGRTDDARLAGRAGVAALVLERGTRRIEITGDCAGGDLALVLAAQVTAENFAAKAKLVGVAVISPVTDLTLSGETYKTRAEADPFFTRPQVLELVQAYLGSADPKDARASALYARVSGLPRSASTSATMRSSLTTRADMPSAPPRPASSPTTSGWACRKASRAT